MRFLFVMDPAEGMLPDKDTTFAFVRGAQKRGHDCLHCLPRDIALVGSRVTAMARPLRVSDSAPHTTLGPSETVVLADLDAWTLSGDYAHAKDAWGGR